MHFISVCQTNFTTCPKTEYGLKCEMQITSSGHLTLGPDSHSDISVQSSHLSYAPCVLNLYFNSKSKSVFHFSRSNDWSKSDHGAMIASLSSSHHDVTPWWPDLMMIETLTCVVAGVVCCCLLLSPASHSQFITDPGLTFPVSDPELTEY